MSKEGMEVVRRIYELLRRGALRSMSRIQVGIDNIPESPIPRPY